MASFEFSPVAFVRSPLVDKADAPRQGRAAAGIQGRVEFEEGQGFEDALRDIDGFDYLWLVSVFDQAEGWRPTVLPPRSERKRGVFATRAPRRPNPIGLTVVRLLRREGLTLFVEELDLLDGTPILDVKPYTPWSDAIVKAATGWLERPADPGETFSVNVESHAEEQLVFLKARGIDLRTRIVDHLSIGPRPHAYRRIRKEGEGFVLSVRDWRAHFIIEGQNVRLQRLSSGAKMKDIVRGDAPTVHGEYVDRFGALGKRHP